MKVYKWRLLIIKSQNIWKHIFTCIYIQTRLSDLWVFVKLLRVFFCMCQNLLKFDDLFLFNSAQRFMCSMWLKKCRQVFLYAAKPLTYFIINKVSFNKFVLGFCFRQSCFFSRLRRALIFQKTLSDWTSLLSVNLRGNNKFWQWIKEIKQTQNLNFMHTFIAS
jgi:hypothetical protein